MCSHSKDGNGNFRGYVANPVMADFNEEDENENCFRELIKLLGRKTLLKIIDLYYN